MILQQVADYLRRNGRATLVDIALHVDAEESAVRGMLERWIRKGQVERRSLASVCGDSCSKCGMKDTEFYIWKEAAPSAKRKLPFPTCK